MDSHKLNQSQYNNIIILLRKQLAKPGYWKLQVPTLIIVEQMSWQWILPGTESLSQAKMNRWNIMGYPNALLRKCHDIITKV